jgi:sulfate transport system permease protein
VGAVTLTALALLAMTVLVVIPVVACSSRRCATGVGAYWRHLTADADTRHSVLLTLTVAPLAVLLNLVFGRGRARGRSPVPFRGRTLLVTLIDVPFASRRWSRG